MITYLKHKIRGLLRSTVREVRSAQHRRDQIEALVVRRWGRQTYDVFMYQRSGHTYEEVAREFELTERAVQRHMVRAMFVLINQKAGEQE
jgi:DNA-directed RNA polymerase specialized sigma24 family protein